MNSNIVITGGIHGNEVGGALAAFCLQRIFPQIPNYSILNPEAFIRGTRGFQGKDLNRQFGKHNVTAENILTRILSHHPSTVITLHEDNEIDYCYIYCSENLRPLAESCIKIMRTHLSGCPTVVHHDQCKNGVITNGSQPARGTLEKELEKYGVNYICFETPELKELSERIRALTHGVTHFIKNYKLG